MLISQALRLSGKDVVTLTGGGGKTTLMFRLAAELVESGHSVVTTMTTRIFAGQMAAAAAHLLLTDEETLLAQLPDTLAQARHLLLAGSVEVEEGKVLGLPPALIDRVAARPEVDAVLVEADGSRRLPFKAPASHEPVVPPSTTVLVPLVGIDVVGQPLDAEHVHRPQLVAELAGALIGDPVTPSLIAAVLGHPSGGGKGLPPGARLVPFLNKVEDDEALQAAREAASMLLRSPIVDAVAIGSLQSADPVREVWSRVAAVVLAAGEGRRYGGLKQLEPWEGRPMLAHVAGQALACRDIDRVAVTVGAGAEQVTATLGELPAQTVPVSDWALGQSRSVVAGLQAVLEPPASATAVLFLLGDQPGITPALLSALVQLHRESLAPIVAPRHAGRRGNPVLFDRATFAEFTTLTGDVGARPILRAHETEIAWLDWSGAEVLQDVDTPGDLRALAPG